MCFFQYSLWGLPMSRVLTRNLTPGMVVDEDVYALNDQLIISKGQKLTDNYINRLVFYSVNSVRIRDDMEELAEVEAPTETFHHEETYAEKVLASKEYKIFRANFDVAVKKIRGYMNDVIERRVKIDEEYLLNEIQSLIVHNENGINLFDMLHNMHLYDDPTYAHSINVALICNIFAKWLGFEPEELNIVTLAGLLHDIGKTKIPEEIITKPAKLTDDEFKVIQSHAREGYNILKETSLNEHVINAALMHHERMDGSGYPDHLEGNQIDPCARIVAIADVYDAMTSRRVYRAALCPFKVISIFESEGYHKYDSQYIYVFLEYIVNTYINNRVRLNDGREGTIVLINKHDLAHPVITWNDSWIDLSKDHSLSVEAII